MEARATSYALSVCFNDHQKPVCLAVSADSVEPVGAMPATPESAQLVGGDLLIVSKSKSLRLAGIDQRCVEAIHLDLPLVVFDPDTQEEVMLQVVYSGAPR